MTQGLAIGERETIEDVAARIGLNPNQVEDVLNSDEFAEFVKYDEEVARDQLKVTGVPFFVFDQRVALAGAQPVEVMKDVLTKAVATMKTEDELQQEAEEKASKNTAQNDALICSDESCEMPKS